MMSATDGSVQSVGFHNMSYGIIEYNSDGLPKCEVCGKHFNRVLSHVRQKHSMTEREYKIMYGFDLKKGIISEQSRDKSRQAVLNNFETVVEQNLIIRGEKSRFINGSKGRTRDQVSAQTKIMLVERARKSMTDETRKQRGREVGLSGLGNSIRWTNKN